MAPETTTDFPAPGAPDLGAPPPLRRDGGAPRGAGPTAGSGTAGRGGVLAESVPAPAPAVTQAPAPDLPTLGLAAALAGTAVGLWLERMLGR